MESEATEAEEEGEEEEEEEEEEETEAVEGRMGGVEGELSSTSMASSRWRDREDWEEEVLSWRKEGREMRISVANCLCARCMWFLRVSPLLLLAKVWLQR